MELSVPTSEKRLKILLKLNSGSDQEINIVGYDADSSLNNPVYFDTDIPLMQGDDIVELSMPVSPKDLIIKINGNKISPTGISTTVYPCTRQKLSDEDEKYMDFLEWFAQNARHIPRNKSYVSPDNRVVFTYTNVIEDEPGTPARVDHNSNVGETFFSYEHIKDYTVPMIVFIGTHERGHYTKRTDSEFEADKHAAKIVLDRGYPKQEVLHAATRVLSGDSQEARQRVQALFEFIQGY